MASSFGGRLVELPGDERYRPDSFVGERDQHHPPKALGAFAGESARDLACAEVDRAEDRDAREQPVADAQHAPAEHVVGQHAEDEDQQHEQRRPDPGDSALEQVHADRIGPPVHQPEKKAPEEDRDHERKGDQQAGHQAAAEKAEEAVPLARFREADRQPHRVLRRCSLLVHRAAIVATSRVQGRDPCPRSRNRGTLPARTKGPRRERHGPPIARLVPLRTGSGLVVWRGGTLARPPDPWRRPCRPCAGSPCPTGWPRVPAAS